jgi:hypothetical protein
MLMDNDFESGFYSVFMDHMLGAHNPKWLLNEGTEFGSRSSFASNEEVNTRQLNGYRPDTATYEISSADGKRIFSYDRTTATARMRYDSSNEPYSCKTDADGDGPRLMNWPHYLLMQSFDKIEDPANHSLGYDLQKYEAIDFTMNLKLNKLQHLGPIEECGADDTTAMFPVYFQIRHKDYWSINREEQLAVLYVGKMMFDERYPSFNHPNLQREVYMKDYEGQSVYITYIPGEELSNEKIYNVPLMGLINDALALSVKCEEGQAPSEDQACSIQGGEYYVDPDINNYVIYAPIIGWEFHGTYDVDLEISDLSLKGILNPVTTQPRVNAPLEVYNITYGSPLAIPVAATDEDGNLDVLELVGDLPSILPGAGFD